MSMIGTQSPPLGGISLDADSIRCEVDEAPDAHDLSEAQAEYISDLDDQTLNQALVSAADDTFWSAYDELRRNAIAALARQADELLLVVSVSGDDYERAVDEANDAGGSTRAVVQYLAQWDTGDEVDRASLINGRVLLRTLEGWPHQLHEVTHDDTDYFLVIDHHLRFYSLYRRPLG